MKVFHARGKRGAAVGVLAASVLSSVLGLAPSASAAVFQPCNATDLREAARAAADNAEADTIILNPKCKYVFTMGDPLNDPNAAIFSDEPLTIAGNGATIEIKGDADLRHITSLDDLTLNNLTLKGGEIESPYALGGDDLLAGSILHLGGDLRADKLTVKDSEVNSVGDDATAVGGGIVVAGAAGDATFVRSTIKNNQVNAYGLTAIGAAGGIYFDGGGDLTLTRSTVHDNEVEAAGLIVAVGVGGGVVDTGGLVLTESTVSSNEVSTRGLVNMAAGGGLYLADGDHTMDGSKVTGNKVSADGPVSLAVGGGILNGGVLTDDGSTISSNKATCKSSGFCLAAGGGYANRDLISGPGDATFVETTFKSNKAEGKNGAGAGGGLAVAGGTTVLEEATVTKNEAKGDLRLGGGIANFGDPGDVFIDASDIYKNKPKNCYGVPECEY
jgi:hypothetical protein